MVIVTAVDRVLWEEAFGIYNIETIFQIASSTKSLAATTIYMLGEQGVLPFDSKLRLLLSHSAGVFGNHTTDPIEKDLLRNGHRTLAEAAAGIEARPLAYPPGEGTSYSDAGFFLAGRAAEVATGREFHEVMRDTLLAPLEMEETFYRATTQDASRQAVAYQRNDGVLQPAHLQHRFKRDGLIRVGSGLFSTARDLAKFVRFQLASGERFNEMHVDQTSGRWHKDPMGGTNAGYGYGWQLGDGNFFHAGAHGSIVWVNPQAGIGAVLLTQMPILQVYTLWRYIISMLLPPVPPT